MLLRLSPLVLTVLLTACQSLPTPPQEPERFDLGLATWAEMPAALPPAVVLADIQAPWQAEGSTTAMHYRLAYAQPHHRHAYSQAHWSLPPSCWCKSSPAPMAQPRPARGAQRRRRAHPAQRGRASAPRAAAGAGAV